MLFLGHVQYTVEGLEPLHKMNLIGFASTKDLRLASATDVRRVHDSAHWTRIEVGMHMMWWSNQCHMY
jgi:hypothetical protein